MPIFYNITKKLISLYPKPVHPLNLNNDGVKSYAEWQLEKGGDTLKGYMPFISPAGIFNGKIVLDIGCGAAGKTIYYAKHNVKKIYGLEILEKYRSAANAIAKKENLADKFEFVCADGANTGFEDDFFDVIIMNDVVEHVDNPENIFNECYRILKPGGRIYLNFPPYYHPTGAHLSDAIGIPWVQCFFSDSFLIKLYKDLVKDLPDGSERIEFRISTGENGKEYFSYINKMTIKKFKKLKSPKKFKILYYNERPVRSVFKIAAKTPKLKELFVGMVTVILEK